MTEIADRFRTRADHITELVEAVPDDRWASPSPCEGWTARDVVGHLVGNCALFLGFVDRELPPAPSVEEDPIRAWSSSRHALQAGLDDPAVAGQEFEGFMGRSTFEAGVGRFLCFDLVVHAWDLARAAGLDERLDPDAVRDVLAVAETFSDSARVPGVFGPALEPPPGADEQIRMLALLGRRA